VIQIFLLSDIKEVYHWFRNGLLHFLAFRLVVVLVFFSLVSPVVIVGLLLLVILSVIPKRAVGYLVGVFHIRLLHNLLYFLNRLRCTWFLISLCFEIKCLAKNSHVLNFLSQDIQFQMPFTWSLFIF
jgi:hypothetical protein